MIFAPLRRLNLAIVFVLLCLLIPNASASQAQGGSTIVYLPLVSATTTPVIPDTTEVLLDHVLSTLTDVSSDGQFTFSQSDPSLSVLNPGDIMVGGISPATPYGFLRKVQTIADANGTVIITTVPATLEEAISDGSFSIRRELTPNMIQDSYLAEGIDIAQSPDEFYITLEDVVLYDEDGNHNTTSDQIRANGEFSFEPGFEMSGSIQSGRLESLTIAFPFQQTMELEIESAISLLDGNPEREILRQTLSPVVVYVGVVPVVLVPVLSVNVGIDGSVAVGVTTRITHDSHMRPGIQYHSGQWSGINEHVSHFDYSLPTVFGSVEVQGYIGPRASLLLYGVAGPYVDNRAYLELEANTSQDPLWELFAGLEVVTGVRMDLLSIHIESPTLTVIGYRISLAHAGEGGVGQLAFVSNRDGDNEIFIGNSDGTGITQLTSNSVTDEGPTWSPDGSKIAFHSARNGGNQIYVMNADGSNVQRLVSSDSSDEWAYWSPTGNFIAFARVADFDGNGVRSEAFVVNEDGSGLRRLTYTTTGSNGYNDGCWPSSWTPNGTRLILYCYKDSTNKMYSINTDGTDLQPILHDGAWNAIPSMAPDGNSIAFASYRDGNYEIYLTDISSSTPQRLTFNQNAEWRPIWTDDGARIIFESNREGATQLYWMNKDGSDQKPMFSHASYNGQPAWRP